MACKNKIKAEQSSSEFIDNIAKEIEHEKLGENFSQFRGKPKGAIDHLLKAKRGQVIGAMNKKGLGDIDFIYGEVTDAKKHKGYGLAHVVDKHGEGIARKLPQILKDGIVTLNNGRRAIIETPDHRVVVGLVFDDIDKVWLVSGYEMTDAAKAKSPALAKVKKDMNASSFTASVVNRIIADKDEKIKIYKNAKDKKNAIVDIVWKTVMQGFDLGAMPVKHILGAMNEKIDPNAKWFEVTELQKEVSEVINDHRNVKAGIYDNAGEIKEYLGTLSKDDSKSLVHALGGDIKLDDLNPKLKELYKTFRNVIDKKADELVELGVLDEKNKISDYLKRYYKQYVEDGHSGSSLAYDKLQKRKDLTMDERIALGMLEDADFVIPQTIAEQNIQIEKAKTLKKLADKFGKDEEFENSIKISDESVGGGVKKWGALAGKYVPKEVKSEIDNARFVQEQTKILEDGLYPIIDHLKVNMTVKNPVTHVYNIASNMLLAGLNGDLKAVGKVLYMRYKTPNKFKALVKKANQYGLNSYLDDFEQAHVALEADGKTVNPIASIYKNLYMTQDSKLGKGVRNLYDWEDKIFKLSAFKKYLDEGVAEKDAFKNAVDVYVDYSTPLPAGVKFLDKSGLMPFLHYQYKSTPAVAKVMAQNKLRTFLMASGIAALGISSFQNDDEELMTPVWADDKFNLFGVAEWVRLGNGYYLNAGRMIPATKFEFELGGILKSALEIVNGKTPLGYNISGTYDSDLEKYGERALVMMENFMPSATLGRYAQRGVHIGLGELGVVKPKKNYYGEDMDVPELISRAGGVRKFNESKELNSKLKKAKNKKRYKDKQKNADKKANEDEYNTTVRKIESAKQKVGFDLTTDESAIGAGTFDFKVDKFDL